MKKRWIWIAAAVVCVALVLVLALFGFFRNMIAPGGVDRIELHTYDHENYGQADLTAWEAQLVIALFNFSRQAGEVEAEPCCDGYRLEIYFADGREITISEGVDAKLIVRQSGHEPYCISGRALIDYIFALAEKYDLPLDKT